MLVIRELHEISAQPRADRIESLAVTGDQLSGRVLELCSVYGQGMPNSVSDFVYFNCRGRACLFPSGGESSLLGGPRCLRWMVEINARQGECHGNDPAMEAASEIDA